MVGFADRLVIAGMSWLVDMNYFVFEIDWAVD